MFFIQCKIILIDVLEKNYIAPNFDVCVVKNIQVIYSHVMVILYFLINK